VLTAVPMTLREANEFVLNFHRHNKPTRGMMYAVGATAGSGLVGVGIAGRPVSRILDDGKTLECTRNCVIDGAPKGTCSFYLRLPLAGCSCARLEPHGNLHAGV
jgi:hypothetical protein